MLLYEMHIGSRFRVEVPDVPADLASLLHVGLKSGSTTSQHHVYLPLTPLPSMELKSVCNQVLKDATLAATGEGFTSAMRLTGEEWPSS
jgi:hypothetical protein